MADRPGDLQRIPVARAAIVQAEENLRVARGRYLQQRGTNTEVLDAETFAFRAMTTTIMHSTTPSWPTSTSAAPSATFDRSGNIYATVPGQVRIRPVVRTSTSQHSLERGATMDKDFKRMTDFLVGIGIEQIPHTQKSYLAHLIAVFR